jgi:DNA-binding CsgD family transcriptional regulator
MWASVKNVGAWVVPGLVGRGAELEKVRDLWRAAGKGEGSVVAISGDHGVGKTRLAREIAALAERSGGLSLWGQGRDDEGSPGYWPWAEVVAHCGDRLGRDRVRELMGGSAGDIARVIPTLPTVAAAIPSSGPPTQQARYRVFAAMRAFLERAAEDQPIAVILDDLHYCDPDTLRVFEAVASDIGRSRLLLVGTYVERRALQQPVLSSVIAETSKLPWCCSLPVSNLTVADVRALLEREVGKRGASGLAPAVHRQTEGNALFVVEAVRAVAARVAAGHEALGDDHWEEGAAGGVAMLVGRRLGRLDPPSLAALRAAAVIGRAFDGALLAAAMRMQPDQARAALAEPIADGFVIETAPDHYRFAHELVQRAVAAGLAPLSRATLHLAAAQALEARQDDSVPVEPGLLAWHFANAGTEHQAKAARYAAAAGEKAMEAAAYDTALRFFEQAAATSALTAADRARIARLRAWTLFALTRFGEVSAHLEQAFDLYARAGDMESAVEVAEFATYPQGAERLPREPIRRLRERALALVAPGSALEARLLCEIAGTLWYNYGERAGACLDQALETARKHSDQRLEARVHFARAWWHYRQVAPRAAVDWGERALDTLRGANEPSLELLVGGRVVVWKLLCGDIPGAEGLERHLRSRHDNRPSLWSHELQRGERLLRLWRGRWTEAGPLMREWVWSRDVPPVAAVAGGSGLPVAYSTARQLIEDVDQHPDHFLSPDRLAMRALEVADSCRSLGYYDDLPAARDLAERALAMELSPLGRVFALVAIGFVGAHRGDRALIERACAPEIMAAPPDFILDPPGIVLDSVRALFFGLAGLHDAARECHERALAFCRRCELVWETYATCIYYAAFLLRHGERSRARELTDEAERVGRPLAQAGFEHELAGLRARLDGVLPDGLTQREVEVMGLAAQGLATKQIAGELNISYYTATNHLRHIYAKTGCRSRVELASYVRRHHLASEPATPI